MFGNKCWNGDGPHAAACRSGPNAVRETPVRARPTEVHAPQEEGFVKVKAIDPAWAPAWIPQIRAGSVAMANGDCHHPTRDV